MKTDMTFDEMVACLSWCDMAMVCDNCGKNTWEDGTPMPEDFHADGCPLKGRRGAHADHVNYAYIDSLDYAAYLADLGARPIAGAVG